MTSPFPELDPRTYGAHPIHREERAWIESNCYVDLWIEVLHAAGLDPVAGLAFTLAQDFEGDQWTFFKYPLADLSALYGIDVFELNIWRSLVHHVGEQVDQGRVPIVEIDAFFLPDTAGTSYRREHVKTSIAVRLLDLEGRRLGYFHNAGYFELGADDFDGAFRLAGADVALPPYVEVAKLGARPPLAGGALAAQATELARTHLRSRPQVSPFARYRARFEKDLAWLRGEDLSMFHAYAFASLRQFGACSELAGIFLKWLEAHGEPDLAVAAADFDTIAQTAKVLQFKTARAVGAKKPMDVGAVFDTLETAYASAIDRLVARLGP